MYDAIILVPQRVALIGARTPRQATKQAYLMAREISKQGGTGYECKVLLVEPSPLSDLLKNAPEEQGQDTTDTQDSKD